MGPGRIDISLSFRKRLQLDQASGDAEARRSSRIFASAAMVPSGAMGLGRPGHLEKTIIDGLPKSAFESGKMAFRNFPQRDLTPNFSGLGHFPGDLWRPWGRKTRRDHPRSLALGPACYISLIPLRGPGWPPFPWISGEFSKLNGRFLLVVLGLCPDAAN